MTKYRAEGQFEKIKKVVTAGITLTLAIALPIALTFMLFGKHFTFLFADERCLNIFLVVIPGLIFTSVYAVLRGVFWGNKDFLPYSVTELLEEICMIIVGIVLIETATDVYDGSAKAGVAVLISYIFSFTLSTTIFFLRKNKLKNPASELKPLLKSAMPITAMRTATSITSSLMSVILPLRLIAFGYTKTNALSLFGSAVGQAFPLLTIPITLIGSFILVLVPEISENYYGKNYYYLKRDVEKAIKFSTMLTCFFVPIFTVCGKEIGTLVFGNAEAGSFVSFSAFLMPLMSLSTVSTSILNSIGFENRTLFYYVLGGILMLLCIWFLPAVFGIYSLVAGFTCLYGLTTVLNLILLNKKCVVKPNYLGFLSYSFSFILPSSLIGIMLEKLLILPLGLFFTFAVCSMLIFAFNLALYFGFELISINAVIKRLPILKNKKSTT